jgi:hypothetical protein
MPKSRGSRIRTCITVITALALLGTVGVVQLGAAEPELPANRVPDRLLVKFKDGVPGADRAATRSAVGATLLSSIPQLGVDVVHVPEHAAERALSRLQNNPRVDYVEFDTKVQQTTTAEVIPNDEF